MSGVSSAPWLQALALALPWARTPAAHTPSGERDTAPTSPGGEAAPLLGGNGQAAWQQHAASGHCSKHLQGAMHGSVAPELAPERPKLFADVAASRCAPARQTQGSAGFQAQTCTAAHAGMRLSLALGGQVLGEADADKTTSPTSEPESAYSRATFFITPLAGGMSMRPAASLPTRYRIWFLRVNLEVGNVPHQDAHVKYRHSPFSILAQAGALVCASAGQCCS